VRARRGAALRQSVAGYLALRIVLFLAVALLLRLVGLTGLVLVVLALLVSGILAFPIARRQRNEMVDRARDSRH
jgi:Flp pilus assembly protein TadB